MKPSHASALFLAMVLPLESQSQWSNPIQLTFGDADDRNHALVTSSLETAYSRNSEWLAFARSDTLGYMHDSISTHVTYFGPQDVAGYVFWTPDTGVLIREVWLWTGGTNTVGRLQIWQSNYGPDADQSFVDSTGWMGYYPDIGDGHGEVTPFRDEASEDFVSSQTAIGFDPLGQEIWLPGGLDVLGLSGAWMGIILGDWYMEPSVLPNEPFIVTFQNVSPDTIRLPSFFLPPGSGWQGLKFYEFRGTSPTGEPGWFVRGSMWIAYIVIDVPNIVTVEKPPDVIPTEYALYQNFPNPFNPSTTIRYELPARSHVVLKILNVLGQEMVTLVDDEKEAGTYQATWNANGFSSGVYFYRLTAGRFAETKKLLFLR